MGEPGVLLVVAAHEPTSLVRPLDERPLTIGREAGCELAIKDAELSRKHCDVAYLGDGRFRVVDRESQNGTYVNGDRVGAAGVVVNGARLVVRAGGSVLLLEHDLHRFAGGVSLDDGVVGPVLRVAYAALESAARDGLHVVIEGENGTGKERAARAFHAASRNAAGPFVAINCATAERVRSLDHAAGGVIFLDELDALDPDAQATLVARAEAVPGALVAAATTAPRDLYTRVVLPPVRERRAEISYLVAHALLDIDVEASAGLVEECLARRWPANVRELVGSVQAAARAAISNGSDRITANDLPSWAGRGGLGTDTTEHSPIELPLVHPR